MITQTTNISRLRMHEHDGSLHDLLGLIEQSTSAASLQTPWQYVDGIAAEANGQEANLRARELLNRFGYSGAPLVWENQVRGVFVRPEPNGPLRYEGIVEDHFVPVKTSMLQVIRRMRDCNRIVLGVGTPEAPVGWITYADFSKRPFRVLLFAIVAEVEVLLAHALDTAHPDDSWFELLPKEDKESRDRNAALRQRQMGAMSWDAAMPLTTFAEIGNLIAAVPRSPEALRILGEDVSIANRLRALSSLRNRVSHVVKPVVAGPKDIATVANHIDTMLDWINRWPVAMRAAGQNGTPS